MFAMQGWPGGFSWYVLLSFFSSMILDSQVVPGILYQVPSTINVSALLYTTVPRCRQIVGTCVHKYSRYCCIGQVKMPSPITYVGRYLRKM